MLIFVSGLVQGFDNDKYGKVPLPGEGRVMLPKGDVTVFYEERVGYPDGLRSYTVRSARTRQPVPSTPAGGTSYEINNVNGVSVDKLMVPEEGEYLVTGRAQAQHVRPAGADLRAGDQVRCDREARSRRRSVIGLVFCVLFALLARAFRAQANTRAGSAAALQRAHGRVADAPAAPASVSVRGPASGRSARLEEDRRMGRIAEAEYQARRQQILDRI